MVKKLSIIVALLIGAGLLVSAGFQSGLETNVPPDGSVTEPKLADEALSAPRLYNRGFNPDTPRVCIVFDDGHAGNTYTNAMAWNDSGFVFSFGVPRNVIGGSGKLTAPLIRALEANGNEIMNHGWALGGDYYLSHCSAQLLDLQINNTYDYFTDTVGVSIHGFNYPAGDYCDAAWVEISKRHEYASGLHAIMNLDYEADSSISYDDADYFWRYTGSLEGNADTVKWSALAGSTHYSTKLIFPNSAMNPWLLPIGGSQGPGSGDGTLKTITAAKYLTWFAERNAAATSFYFHDWDSCSWIGAFFEFLKAEQDAGRIKVVTQHDIVRDYLFTPVRSGHNLFPAQHLTSSYGNKPDGFAFNLWGSGTITWYLRADSSGFGGNTNCAEARNAAAAYKTFVRSVPGDCYVTASIRANGYGAYSTSSDSVVVSSWLQVVNPRLHAAYSLNETHIARAYPEAYDTGAPSGRLSDACGSQFPGPTDGEGFTKATYKMQRRAIYGNRDVWKEIRMQRYVNGPAIIHWTIAFEAAPPNGWAASRGIKLDDAIFTVVRRAGAGGMPTRQ